LGKKEIKFKWKPELRFPAILNCLCSGNLIFWVYLVAECAFLKGKKKKKEVTRETFNQMDEIPDALFKCVPRTKFF
jgi:hypothetical protein